MVFVVFEGIDGSGKGTQLQLLKNELKKQKEKFFVFKYPTKKAKKIREFLTQKIELDEDEAFFEYLKDIESQQPRILECLNKGWVISDRYFFSTIAYQSVEKSIEKRIEYIKSLKMIKPDYVFWLSINPQVAIQRKLKNKLPDRFEKDLEKLNKIEQNYELLYKMNFYSKKWVKLDAQEDKKTIFEQIKKELFKK
ncbi:MAG: dTMP kinase [Candidatus Micrarchaeota archaeon]|nr:dTMP kinase [Candidatus Micrarchaeota archaeon]